MASRRQDDYLHGPRSMLCACVQHVLPAMEGMEHHTCSLSIFKKAPKDLSFYNPVLYGLLIHTGLFRDPASSCQKEKTGCFYCDCFPGLPFCLSFFYNLFITL